jgi:hypothetical protein
MKISHVSVDPKYFKFRRFGKISNGVKKYVNNAWVMDIDTDDFRDQNCVRDFQKSFS